jgi:hypothetical protein
MIIHFQTSNLGYQSLDELQTGNIDMLDYEITSYGEMTNQRFKHEVASYKLHLSRW